MPFATTGKLSHIERAGVIRNMHCRNMQARTGDKRPTSGHNRPMSMSQPTRDPGGIDRAITAEIRAELGVQKMQRLELSARSGIPVRSLSTYLADKRTMNLGQISAVAQALGMDLTTLVERASKRAE